MNRRSFIAEAGAATLTQLLTGCGKQNQPTLRLRLLKNSVPTVVLNRFRLSAGREVVVDVKIESQLNVLFEQLQAWKNQTAAPNKAKSSFSLPFFTSSTPPVIPDVSSLGDYWLANAIKQKLIQPIDTTQLSGWQQLPPRWQELVRRGERGQLDPKGQIWAAPYRWGTTLIAYRTDKFKSLGLQPPTDWSDLWREELRARISLLDHPREVIGLTLKKLGQSYNTTALDKIPELKKQLQLLHRQVKLYSSNAYLQPLILGDTFLAVGWSSDILPAIRDYPKIAAVVPQSGTALWADLWVQPRSPLANPGSNLVPQWIDFIWKPEIATQISLQTLAVSPIFSSAKPENLPKALQANHQLLPLADIFKNSEFLLPLDDAALAQYRQLWIEIRTTNTSIK
ncbi:MAG: extracellular solute-binding protein [Oscillatoriaceae bacterium SKW80]|nr:extracellular solute-binding protein [Oscillatoriaceae bacterium SKW80]HIK28212.1 extracellular solute-binding protein [Oscillatoriaceae cyanobacterium M7585_C2015_266]